MLAWRAKSGPRRPLAMALACQGRAALEAPSNKAGGASSGRRSAPTATKPLVAAPAAMGCKGANARVAREVGTSAPLAMALACQGRAALEAPSNKAGGASSGRRSAPTATRPLVAAPAAMGEPETLRAATLRVLLVGSDPALVRASLQREDGPRFEICCARGARRALAILRRMPIDVVLFDHAHPGQIDAGFVT